MTQRQRRGFTIVELIVAISVIGIVIGSAFAIGVSGIRLSRANQARINASGITNKTMEIIKNLPYDNVGTINGTPAGSIEDQTQETINGIVYTVDTTIQYVDDPYDDVFPTDAVNNDYKLVDVVVQWTDRGETKSLSSSTRIVPDGLEELDDGGTLWIEVFDPWLDPVGPVEGATVTVDAPSLFPPVSETGTTDSDGRFILQGVPPGIEAYEVVVSKSGYNTEQTYTRDSSNPNPNPAHLNVEAEETTVEYFQLSELVDNLTVKFVDRDENKGTVCHNVTETIHVADPAILQAHIDHGDYHGVCDSDIWNSYVEVGDPVEGVSFTMHGQKDIGTDLESLPIYKFLQTQISDVDGEYAFTDIDYDAYDILVDEPTEGYVIEGFNQVVLPHTAYPNSTQTVALYVGPHVLYSGLFSILNGDDTPIRGASVRIYDGSYDTTLETNAYGQVFFNDLSQGSFTIEVTNTGYDTHTDTLMVTGNERQTIYLSQSV